MDECWDGILPNHIYYAMLKSCPLNIIMPSCDTLQNHMIRAEKADICRAIISFVQVWQIVMNLEG